MLLELWFYTLMTTATRNGLMHQLSGAGSESLEALQETTLIKQLGDSGRGKQTADALVPSPVLHHQKLVNFLRQLCYITNALLVQLRAQRLDCYIRHSNEGPIYIM